MSRKSEGQTLSSLLKSTARLVNSGAPYIPSITEFCESKTYLGLHHLPNPIRLYPVQRLILRAFYRGSEGNTSQESMTMTAEELSLCQRFGLDNEKNGNIIAKWNSGEIFRELVLVWGRRSGKDFCISIIALYEAMKLLEVEGGDPYRKYGLGDANPFTILTIANSKEQAKILFREIHGKLLFAPYFKDKFLAEGIKAESIHLLTPQDKINNEKRKAQGLQEDAGHIVIEAGHSNSNTLVGKSCFVLLLDEVAAFKQTSGAGSGEAIFGNLSPTTKTYNRREVRLDTDGKPALDKDGNPLESKVIYDGKIISISSPRGMDGKFYDLYNTANVTSQRLMCRLPTWVVNPGHTEESLRNEEKTMTEEKFMMEYGAEFSGTEGENFFSPSFVEACFANHRHSMMDMGVPGITYFAHLDPAISNHNYALVMVHKELFLNPDKKGLDFNIVVDHVRYWTPIKGKPININDVDNYVLWLNRRFHLGLVTYDQWNCIDVNSYLTTAYGLKRAGDIDIDDMIYGRNGTMNRVLKKEVKEGIDGFKIRTKFGYELECTKNHPLFNGETFIEARNLSVGDKVCLCDFSSFGKEERSLDALISGYIVSEGSVYKDSITFHNTDGEVIEDFKSLVEQALYSPKTYAPPMNRLSTHQGYAISFSIAESRDLKKRITIENGDCFNKCVPAFVLAGSKETVASFLSSLYEGDGNTCRNPNALLVEYNTASADLAKQVHLLLLQFGIKSSLKYYTNKYFDGKQCPFYRISIYGENIDIFAKEIGFRSSRKNAELAELLRLKNEVDLRSEYNRKNRGIRTVKGKKKSRSRLMTDRIVAIEPVKTTICHIEVSGDHTYISNGLVSHNSQQSITKLRTAGIPSQETRFGKPYKIRIYNELEALINQGKLKIPFHKTLKDEMLNLQRKYMSGGYRIYPKKEGEVTTDDLCDALAGACYNALQTEAERLPRMKLVNVAPSSMGPSFTSMQGVSYGMKEAELINRLRGNRN